MSQDKYDIIIIGSGQGGNPLAGALAKAGWRVALVEKRYLGGTCVNYGCTPTKVMVSHAKVAWHTKNASKYGVETSDTHVDLSAIRERRRSVVEQWRSGVAKGLDSLEYVEVIMGEASFRDANTILVKLNTGGERLLWGEKIVVNTGARSYVPPIKGLEAVPYLDNETIMELDEVPEHLVIIGGGYISLEFGQMFRRFGSDVTIIEKASQMVPKEDRDIANTLRSILEEDGIAVLCSSEVTSVTTSSEQKMTLEVDSPEGAKSITASHLLVAVGRTPNTDMLNLESAGVKTTTRGQIIVDDYLATSVEGIYAIGDVKGGPAFTHVSYDDYRILRDIFLHQKERSVTDRLLVYTLFTDPQLGRVGLNEDQATEKGLKFMVHKMPMNRVARAYEMAEDRGLVKALVEVETDKILGASVLGVEGGEIMAMIQIAMMGELTATQLREGMFAHPTFAEGLNNLFA